MPEPIRLSQIMQILKFLPAQQRSYVRDILFDNPELLLELQNRLERKTEAMRKRDTKALRAIEQEEQVEVQGFLDQLAQMKIKAKLV